MIQKKSAKKTTPKKLPYVVVPAQQEPQYSRVGDSNEHKSIRHGQDSSAGV